MAIKTGMALKKKQQHSSCYISLKVTVTFFILPFTFPGIKLAIAQFIMFFNSG
jgi:hypothetical protein